MVIIVDVPVDLRQDLIVLLIHIGEVADITGIVIVLLLEELAHRLEVGIAGAGDVALLICGTVLTREKAGVGLSVILILCTGEEEELILDDRTAEGEAVGLLILIIELGHIDVADLGTGHPLTTLVGVSGSGKDVGSGLGDGVDGGSGEVGETDIEGGDIDRHLLDSVEGDRLCRTTGHHVARETEVVTEGTTIDGDVIHTTVTTGEGAAIGLRCESGEVAEASGDGRELLQLLRRDRGEGTGALAIEDWVLALGSHGDTLEQLGVLTHTYVEDEGLTELESDPLGDVVPVADEGHLDGVGSTDTHIIDEETTLSVRQGVVGRAGGRVGHADGGSGQRLMIIAHRASHGGGGDLSQRGQRYHRQETDEQHREDCVVLLHDE